VAHRWLKDERVRWRDELGFERAGTVAVDQHEGSAYARIRLCGDESRIRLVLAAELAPRRKH
jgi:hypothetical protein